mgnify:CR=1 FL=1
MSRAALRRVQRGSNAGGRTFAGRFFVRGWKLIAVMLPKCRGACPDLTALLTAVARKHRKAKLSLPLQQGTEGPEELGQTDKLRWISLLVQYMINADLPVVFLMPEGTEADEVLGAHVWQPRVKTRRNRARCWKRFDTWLDLART